MRTNVAPAPLIVMTAIMAVVFVLEIAPANASPQETNASTSSSAPAHGASAANGPTQESAPAATPRANEEIRARILMATKRYAEAAQAYRQLSQEDPHNSSYPNFAGIALMQVNDLEGARKLFARATKINRKFADGFNNIGAIDYTQKKYNQAIRQYRKALAIEPRTAGFYGNLGYAYFGEKRYPEALKAFQTALALDPSAFQQNDRNGSLLQYRSVADRGLFDFMLAKSFAQKGDAANCAAYLRRALDDGYKKVPSVRSDPAFVKVLADPDVKTILDQATPPAETARPAGPHGA